MGFGVWGLRFRVKGVGWVWGEGCEFRVWGVGSGFKMWGVVSGCQVDTPHRPAAPPAARALRIHLGTSGISNKSYLDHKKQSPP